MQVEKNNNPNQKKDGYFTDFSQLKIVISIKFKIVVAARIIAILSFIANRFNDLLNESFLYFIFLYLNLMEFFRCKHPQTLHLSELILN